LRENWNNKMSEAGNFEPLNKIIKEKGDRIIKKFEEWTICGVQSNEMISALDQVIDYWTDSFRPALTALCCEAVGGSTQKASEAGLMITLASAGIGIHDDIIDRSTKKHFRKTIFGLIGADKAMLIGDFLFTKAWILGNEITKKSSNPHVIAEVLDAFGAMSFELCENEFSKISLRRQLNLSLKEAEERLWRSATDTEACAKIGAILGGGSSQEVQALATFGRSLGFENCLVNEIKDMLNLEGNLPERLENETAPLPLLIAAKSSRDRYLKIDAILKQSIYAPTELRELIKICFEAKAFEYIHKLAAKNKEKAECTLLTLKPTRERELLALLLSKLYSDVLQLHV
jgi:geranylgeranyl diphosphate synthase type I